MNPGRKDADGFGHELSRDLGPSVDLNPYHFTPNFIHTRRAGHGSDGELRSDSLRYSSKHRLCSM